MFCPVIHEESSDNKKVITVRTTAFEASKESDISAKITKIELDNKKTISEFIGQELSKSERRLIDNLASIAHKKYLEFKSHPLFLRYLNEMSTLTYYGQSNIGSRPASRASDKDLVFEDLRAIPFVGAWGQLKQNVPGYFGIGTALKHMEESYRCARVARCASPTVKNVWLSTAFV